MTRRQWRLERLRAIEREYRVALAAAEGLDQLLRADPNALEGRGLKVKDRENYRTNLESTYLVRLFAEFEAALREAWGHAFGRATRPDMFDLIEAVAARCYIPENWKDSVHSVRPYRNALVHEGRDDAAAMPLIEARSHLGRFLSGLPHRW
ncbi:MAG TPA: hypothetical protein VG406_04060 [Isosphaeraceae bacterium]|jgi:hypothetical protein|nr:hypothetical protein [Isosphaeraceae bacterium]